MPVKTEEDVPEEISLLQFDDISDRAVKVGWAPPKQTNGILLGYQVKYQVKDQPNTMKIVNLTAADTSLKIKELQATTHYVFEVTAWTKIGSGIPKTAVIQSGIEPVLPMPPYQLGNDNLTIFEDFFLVFLVI
jgi:protein sidekick